MIAQGRCAAATLALLLGLTIATTVRAQDAGTRQTREFVQAAAQSDQFETLEATTVLAQSADPAIRAFAQQMIDSHRQTSDSLRQAVSTVGLAPPQPGLGGDQSMFLAALQSTRGVEFDRAYARQQVLAHQAALVTEQEYAANGDDATIRRVAAATVPVITSHLEMAEQMLARLGGS